MGCQRSVPPLAALEQALATLAITPPTGALGAFERYLALLLEANSRLNLTALRDADGIVRRHFVESAALGAALRAAGLLPDGVRVVDVGSGAGFPGLPLRLLWPEARLTLIEATSKKATFLRDTVHALALADVPVLAVRAEAAGRNPALRERFDLTVSRAVAPLAVLAELTLPLVRLGGATAGIKGSRLGSEQAEAAVALRRLGGGSLRELVVPALLAGEAPPPRFFVVMKARPTPADLPRKSGVTSSNPLR